MSSKNLAAIDLGTNSCRLLISDENGNYLYNDAISTRLGEGMYGNMKFTNEAIERGLDCFGKFKLKMNEFEVKHYRAIATAGCRMASNGMDFIKLVEEKTGIEIEVIDGMEEARLNLEGALMNVKGKSKYIVAYDIGGGSTEITLATNDDNAEIIYSVSIPWGARNSSEAFDLVEYNEGSAEKLHQEIMNWVKKFKIDSDFVKYSDGVCCVATSSTALRLASWVKNYGRYEREKSDGAEVSTQNLNEVIGKIQNMNQIEMAQSPYIGENRSFIFQTACVIFKTIYDELEIKNIITSLKTAKDGIIGELVKKYGKIN